jgi:adenine deaminase
MTPDPLRILAVARGDERADLVVRGGRVVNVFTGEIESLEIAIVDGFIAALGSNLSGERVVDVNGDYVVPGLIDAHVHIESSLCTPAQFARAVVPRGVTTVIADPHELANVVGVEAVRWMHAASRGLPLDVVLMGPSCVPATPLGSAGASIAADELIELVEQRLIHGLAEAMNFPGVIAGEVTMRAKFAALTGRPIDGHAPGVTGAALCAYVASGVGTDHESVSADEAREKLSRGLYLLIREATNARNLDALLPVVTRENARRICFCTDDRTPPDLLEHGSIDMMVRRAIAFGVDPIDAIRMGTLNPSECFGLRFHGAIAPGRRADFFTCADLQSIDATRVYTSGAEVAHSRRACFSTPEPSTHLPSTCNFDPKAINLRIEARSDRIRVIVSRPDQLVTDTTIEAATTKDGQAIADPARDLAKIAVIERHRGTGNVGLGFIRGFGLQRGAIAGTVAHDHHNLVCIGTDDASMHACIRAVAAMKGGLAVADGEKILAQLPLPVGGLMSDKPVEDVASAYRSLRSASREALGSPLHDPFMAMSFMALEVIPALKLTDQGLVDVMKFEVVSLFV